MKPYFTKPLSGYSIMALKGMQNSLYMLNVLGNTAAYSKKIQKINDELRLRCTKKIL